VVDELVEGDWRVALRRRWVRVPGDPALVVEVAEPVDGATRPPVVLVHGFAQNRWTWRVTGRSMVGALVDRGHAVHTIELRGHGLSRAVARAEGQDPDRHGFVDYVADVRRVVDGLDDRPFLVGHSLGGAAVVAAAPDLDVRGVVPIAGIFTFATRNRTLRLLGRASLALRPALVGSVRLSTGWAGELLGRLYSISDVAGYGFPIAGWTPGSLERPLLEERLARGFDWTSVDVWLEMARWANGAPVPGLERWSEVRAPLLVLVGDADPLVHPDDAAACLAASGADDKRLVVFDRFHHDAHFGHIDLILGRHAPRVVWPVLLDWLACRSDA
jgi:pimeloyl-ACP methyl ester carboxylesterase